MKFFSQTFQYDDPWPIVSLAFFLRYPNPYASHVISCDVISREFSPSGTLLTKRLILKRGALPKWFPAGIVSRAEAWVVEESEVDPRGKVVRCRTQNLNNVKILRVAETVTLKANDRGLTTQTTQAEILSRFWALKGQIENHGLSKFKSHIERSRQGVGLVLEAIRESRLTAFQPLLLGSAGFQIHHLTRESADTSSNSEEVKNGPGSGTLLKVKKWLWR